MRARGNRPAVSMTIADRVVSWLDPVAGAKRHRAREYLALAGGYEGGSRDKRATRNWRPRQTSANEDIGPDLPDLRSRARDLVRNVPLATGAIATVVTNVIGDGLIVQPQVNRDILGLTPEAAKEWEIKAAAEFYLWAENADFAGRLHFDEMQDLAFRSQLESGDCVVVRRNPRPRFGEVYSLKLQMIESDRLSNPDRTANTATLFEGVELDLNGRPVAYHIANRHPDDALTISGKSAMTWERVPARGVGSGLPQVLHLFKQTRAEQARGVPYLAPVIEAIKQLGRYTSAEVDAAVVQAFFTTFVKPAVMEGDNDAAYVGSSDVDDPTSEIKMGPAAIVDLAPGDDVSFADPTRPNTAFQAFVEAFSAQIGVALELPYEILIKRFTASYSASRAALETAWQFFNCRRKWIAWRFCQPVYAWVITEAVLTGRLEADGFFDDPLLQQAWLGTQWVGAPHIGLDPQKEAAADLIDLQMQVKTREEIINERTGGDWQRKIEQLGRETAALKEAGLSAPAPSGGEKPPSDDEDDETPQEEDEDGAPADQER